MAVTGPQTLRLYIDDPSAIQVARRAGQELAGALGFSAARAEQVAICASELASNIDKHAYGGTLYIQASPASPGLEMLAVDDGPGVEGFERCLVDGYTTTGTLGTGLGAVRRMATRFATYSLPSRGTVVHAMFLPETRVDTPGVEDVDVGALCLPAWGQEVSGDGYRVVRTGRALTLLVVDGLGHGVEAASAAQGALMAFDTVADLPLPTVIETVHRRLRRTRGAAAGVVRLDLVHLGGEFCGVGNVSCAVLQEGGAVARRISSKPGTLGLYLSRTMSHTFELPPHGTVLLHTDGITSRWDLDVYPGLFGRPVAVMAAVLVRDCWRGRDDGTVVVLRPQRSRGRLEGLVKGEAA